MKNKLKIISIITVITITILLMTGCIDDDTYVPPKDLEGTITISPASAEVGDELTAVYSGGEAVSFQWKKNGKNVGTSSTANPNKYTPASRGSYTVTVSASGYNLKTSAAVTVTGIDYNADSINDFQNWLNDQPANKIDEPYIIALNIANSDIIDLYLTLISAPDKYVILDLSVSTLNSIPNYAFYNDYDTDSGGSCVTLTGIILPNSVENIGESAFLSCTNLASINIPDNVEIIGESAFLSCTSLVGINIPNSVITIGESAFSSCTSLTSITIPSSVINIGALAFSGCTSLTSINVAAANSEYSSVNGVLYNNTRTGLIQYPAGKTGNTFAIPNSVENIEDQAFSGCASLTSVTIPDGVIRIGDNAFSRCTNLTGVIIPDSVENIEDYAFYYCAGLTSLTIGSSVENIGYYAFQYCTSIASVTIPDSVTNIGNCAFRNCTSLTSVTLGSGINSINTFAFSDCPKLTSVKFEWTIPSSGYPSYDYPFDGNLRSKFYEYDVDNGTPGTYITNAPVDQNSLWTKE
jgi:hypothetical protein